MDDNDAAIVTPEPKNAPPRPPNPEKQRVLDDLARQLNLVMESEIKPELVTDDQALLQTKSLLDWMDRLVDEEKHALEGLSSTAVENEKILKDRIESVKRVIADTKLRHEPKIDEVVCAESVVHNQIYDLVTDDMAIDDTMYILDKALDHDRIKVDAYLKHTRSLAREQFMKRALASKLSDILGLGG